MWFNKLLKKFMRLEQPYKIAKSQAAIRVVIEKTHTMNEWMNSKNSIALKFFHKNVNLVGWLSS